MRLVPSLSLSALSVSSSNTGASAKATPQHIRIQQGYTTRSAPGTAGGAYVRVAEPHEHDEVARVLARAFARDPGMNWWGGVRELVPAVPEASGEGQGKLPGSARRTLWKLKVYQRALLQALLLSGGFATVAVLPAGRSASTDSARTSEEPSDEAKGAETIVGAALWLQPGRTLDFPVITLLRSGLCKVVFTWGFKGVKVRTGILLHERCIMTYCAESIVRFLLYRRGKSQYNVQGARTSQT